MGQPRKGGRFVKKSELERREKAAASVKIINEKAKRKREETKEPITCIGRRILDLTLLANSMWCEDCDDSLSFRYMEKETRAGMASTYSIRCHRCLCIREVCSSSTVPDPAGKGRSLFAVNCKAALGCIDSGCGHEQLNHFLSALNLPTIEHQTLKRAEKRIAVAVEQVAQDSCRSAIEDEKNLTVQHSPMSSKPANSMDEDPCDEEVGIVAKYDFAWNKRGNGRSYDSLTGFGSVFGHYSKKCLAFATRSKACAMCRRGHSTTDHECAKNWEGSSKAMEPDAAVELLAQNQDFDAAGVKVGILVGDDDSSTIAAVQRETAHHVNKWLDKNHNTKSFTSQLYKASATHRLLTGDVIRYLKRCYTYAVSQNEGNVEGTRRAILNIVNHTYGDHDLCGDWCKSLNNPNYLFKSLPKGEPFQCPKWKEAFKKILEVQASKAAQIAPGGSTQLNESFNHMVATRAPKSRFYGSSSALHTRVAAAVCQKNIGPQYLLQVNKAALLSPGCLTERTALRSEVVRAARSARQGSVQYKRRRLFNKAQGSMREGRDGLTYVKGMGTTMERAAAADAPDALCFIPNLLPLDENCAFVYVDIETTGLEASAQIVQLAAKCGDKCFNKYMLPTKPIHVRASEATGLQVVRGELLYHGKRMPTTPPEQVANEFISFLEDLGSQVILVGHNLVRFDAPRIMRWLRGYSLVRRLCEFVYGLSDTMKLIGEKGMKKQELLAQTYLTSPEWIPIINSAHNAMTDCIVLDGLVKHFEVSGAQLIAKSITLREYFEQQVRCKTKKVILPSLIGMKEKGVSAAMCGKMAEHGITIDELRREYHQFGRKGIAVCLGVQVNGRPRVTTAKKVINCVEDYVSSIL